MVVVNFSYVNTNRGAGRNVLCYGMVAYQRQPPRELAAGKVAAAAHGDHQRPPTPLFFDSCVPLRSVMIINTKR